MEAEKESGRGEDKREKTRRKERENINFER